MDGMEARRQVFVIGATNRPGNGEGGSGMGEGEGEGESKKFLLSL